MAYPCIHKCKHCNRDFFGNTTCSYCSPECREANRKKGYKTDVPSPKRITRYCKNCNKAFFGRKCKIYCSPECRKEGRPPVWNKGRKDTISTRPKTGLNKICEVCGKGFYAMQSHADAKYCSYDCYFVGRWGGSRRETVICVICQSPFEAFINEQRKVCSEPCRAKQISLSHQGEKSHFWRGGKMAPYVGVWKTQRRAARERDGYKCVLCGSTDRIQVHHIIPYRYSQSHDLSNLKTLCRSCHSKEEWKVNPAYRQTQFGSK